MAKQIWIVLYSHKHGIDTWPIFKPATTEEVIDTLRKDGSWDEDEDQDELSYVEVRGPWTIR